MIALNYKAQFLKNETLAKAHRDLVIQDSFIVAVEMALLQYQASLSLTDANDATASAFRYQRLVGAQEFAKVLLNLGEFPPLPSKKTDDKLNYA